MADKKILAITLKAYIPSMNETVLWVGFIDKTTSVLLTHYNTVFLGDDGFKTTEIESGSNHFVETILQAKQNFSIDIDKSSRIKDVFAGELIDSTVEGVISKYNESDFGGITHTCKKIIDHAFQVDESNVQTFSQCISHGVLELISVVERKDNSTVAENAEIAKKYVGDNNTFLNRILKDGDQDNVLLTFNIEKDGTLISAGVVLYNILVESLLFKNVVYSRSLELEKFTIRNFAVDIFHEIEEFRGSKENVEDLSQKIETALMKIHSERLGMTLSSGNNEKISALIKRALPSEFASASITAATENMNSVVVEMLFSPELEKSAETAPDDEEEKTDKNIILVEADLVLSPAKGIKISSLKPGMRVYVLINTRTVTGNRVAKQLNLIEEKRVKPVSGTLKSVKQDKDNNFIVKVGLAGNLIAKAIEEEDIKVKTDLPAGIEADTGSSSRKSLIIGLAVGLFLIIALILFVLFLF